MGNPLSRGSEPPSCPEAGGFHYTMPAKFGYLQRGLSGHGEAESREGRREGEHHQLQDFLLSWLRFPCLYIAPSCHSLWAHSWEETAGRTGRMQVCVPPSPAGCQHRHSQRLAWPPQLQAAHEAFLPPKTPLPASCMCSHGRGPLRYPSCKGHMCKRRPERPGLLWAPGLPICVMKILLVLSYPSFSADSAASGRGCYLRLVHAHL